METSLHGGDVLMKSCIYSVFIHCQLANITFITSHLNVLSCVSLTVNYLSLKVGQVKQLLLYDNGRCYPTVPYCAISCLFYYLLFEHYELYYLPFVGMPSETATAICCMTMGGVLQQFPKLKVCFAHGGIYVFFFFTIFLQNEFFALFYMYLLQDAYTCDTCAEFLFYTKNNLSYFYQSPTCNFHQRNLHVCNFFICQSYKTVFHTFPHHAC